MPVLIKNGTEVLDAFSYEKIEKDLILRENNKNFLQNIKSEQDSIRCLFVGQRESATVLFKDPFIDIIGSDDATTCHIALIVDDSNCSLCHFDDHFMQEGLEMMIKALIDNRNMNFSENESSTFSLYIVGGFVDDRNLSINLTITLFEILKSAPYNFLLKLCIVSKLNDIVRDNTHYPLVYGLGYNIKFKKLFNCRRFLNKGPDLEARSAKHFYENSIMNIYETSNYRLTIGPFEIKKIRYLEQIVKMPDSFLLENFSTSPLQEPPGYAENVRKIFEFMLAHPKLLGTYFIDSKPRIYAKNDDGSWLPV